MRNYYPGITLFKLSGAVLVLFAHTAFFRGMTAALPLEGRGSCNQTAKLMKNLGHLAQRSRSSRRSVFASGVSFLAILRSSFLNLRF